MWLARWPLGRLPQEFVHNGELTFPTCMQVVMSRGGYTSAIDMWSAGLHLWRAPAARPPHRLRHHSPPASGPPVRHPRPPEDSQRGVSTVCTAP